MRAVIVPTITAVLLLAVLVGVVLDVSTSRSDALALERQNRLVEVAIKRTFSSIINDQEASTLWDDAVIRVRERPLDLTWIDNNLGVWFHTYYEHDETYLLDRWNRPLYAMQDGKRAAPETFARVAAQSLPLATELRGKLRSGVDPNDDGIGQTPGAHDLALLGNRPAIISVKPIVPESERLGQSPGTEYLHISVRYLDRSFLATLSSEYGIERARFSRSRTGAAAVPIVDDAGRVIGYFAWSPFQPGSQVWAQFFPFMAIALALAGVFMGLLLRRIWRSRIDLEASRAEAQHQAFHDALTGLPNRALFEDRLGHAMSRSGRTSGLALLLLDLDRFKHVNDTFGHQAGDALIRDFGMRFSSLLREGDTVARVGGDEFAIIVENATTVDAERLCRRILQSVSRPFEVSGSQAFVGVSIGVAMAPQEGGQASELTRQADIALYRAKEDGRNIYRLFSPAMDDAVKLRSSIEEELRHALATGQGLGIHYQPTVAGRDGSIVGFEALVRWRHSSRGVVAPEQFVRVAEDTQLIGPLGEWVLREACGAAVRRPGQFMAVNLSPVQFRAPDFFERVMRIVSDAGASPTDIQLEITEHVMLTDDETVQGVLARLREAGFRIALDDFGTGYSSLSYLRKFPVDKIKIDQSFVRSLGKADDSAGIVMAVLALGRALGLTVVAEGVETSGQRDFLVAAGCDEMQGFYFSKGVPEAELTSALEAFAARSAAA